MIYQPRNVQPSGVSIDGLLDNTFTMEIQTNSYVSAYQLLIVDFDNNEIYTGSKTTLTNYAYNGDTLEIPVNASTVALSNGTNYKWRVRLYQPTADMLITYGLVQATSTTTTIYLQPNINIKAGMALTINSQTKTISSYNSDTGVAVVSSAFASAPAVGTQYKIYSDFIETVPDYIVYARRTPAVAISNVPSSLTLKYHTFQGTYTQSDNVAIVYHQFDLYTRNDDGTISLVASSDKVYSANLSYTYDSFRTGNKYLIQMTVENDMGIISTTDMYEFTVSYDIVEYLQQPLASFDDKNNAVKVSWVTPVENEATSLRSDAATGIIQDNNSTLTQATFEPGQSIGEGDVVQITNSDCELVVDGKSTQETRSGKNLFNYEDIAKIANGVTINKDGWITATLDNSTGTSEKYLQYYTNNLNILTNTTYCAVIEIKTVSGGGRLHPISKTDSEGQFPDGTNYQFSNLQAGDIKIQKPTSRESFDGITYGLRTVIAFPAGASGEITFRISILQDVSTTVSTFKYEPYGVSPSPDYPSEIESVGYENLFKPTLIADDGATINVTNATVQLEDDEFVLTCKNGTDMYFGQVANEGVVYDGTRGNLIDISNYSSISYNVSNDLLTSNFITFYNEEKISLGFKFYNVTKHTIQVSNMPSGTRYIAFRFGYSKATIGETYRTKVQIEKGSTMHPYIPYGKTGIEVKTVGKNLLKNITTYKWISNVGASLEIIDDYIKVVMPNSPNNASGVYSLEIKELINELVGKKIVYSFYAKADKERSITYECGGKARTSINLTTEWKRFYAYIESAEYKAPTFYCGNTLDKTPFYIKDIMLEVGDTLSDYKPYQERISVLALNAPLRSLPSGVKDIAYIKNGKLYVDRYIGSRILNGTEGWNMNAGVGFHSPVLQGIVKNLGNGMSNKYIYTDLSWQGNYTFSINSTGILAISDNTYSSVEDFKTWLSSNNVQVNYELATPVTEEIGDSTIPYIDDINYMYISSNIDTTFSLVYPYKTISGNTYDYIEFNPPGVKQTGTIKSYNAITGVGTLMSQYPFTYSPIQGDPYAVISNIYNISGFSYLYNTPYNTVNSLYTHGYTATWATSDGLCVLPDDFNITLQFSPDGNFFYDQNGVYQEVVDVITTETEDINNKGEFTIRIDKNKLIFSQQSEDGGNIVWDGNTEGKVSAFDYLYKVSDIMPSKEQLIGNQLSLTSPDGTINTFKIMAEDDGVSSDICYIVDMDDKGNYAIATLLPAVLIVTTPTTDFPSTGLYFISYNGAYVSELGLGSMILEAPFYTHTSQVFVLSSANIAQINNDYVWDDTATWTDTYTWVEGGTSLERVCNHWWKVQITNTGIKIEEIFPTT